MTGSSGAPVIEPPVAQPESPAHDTSATFSNRRPGAPRYFCCVCKCGLEDEVANRDVNAARRDSPPAVTSAVSQRTTQVASREARAAAARASVQAAVERERGGSEKKKKKMHAATDTTNDDAAAVHGVVADPIDDEALVVDDVTAEVQDPPPGSSTPSETAPHEDESGDIITAEVQEPPPSTSSETDPQEGNPAAARSLNEDTPRGGALRRFRKGISRTTGISGFFSGKAKPQVARGC